MKDYFELLARYNRWANRRVYDAVAALPEAHLWEDRGAFFHSVMGTLNHILVADRLWQARINGEPAPALRLDDVLYRDLPSLRHARDAEDQRILTALCDFEPARFSSILSYANTKGEPSEQPLAWVLGHVFNHQTHHRGQVHTLVEQIGHEAPSLDLVYFMRES